MYEQALKNLNKMLNIGSTKKNTFKNKNMKKLLLLAIVGLGFASCEKGEFILVDTVTNQGTEVIIANGLTIQPNESLMLDHVSEYSIVCIGDCKVNINGGIFYSSGVYQNNLSKKQY